jgi:hypothetical protein
MELLVAVPMAFHDTPMPYRHAPTHFDIEIATLLAIQSCPENKYLAPSSVCQQPF